jgi:hypothetical protein
MRERRELEWNLECVSVLTPSHSIYRPRTPCLHEQKQPRAPLLRLGEPIRDQHVEGEDELMQGLFDRSKGLVEPLWPPITLCFLW